jgi:type IV pilus assembly protein PilE
MKNNKRVIRVLGFTLVELMIVVAIVAALAAIAIPSYMDQVRKARRATIVNDMQECASMQERRYTVNNSYSDTVCNSVVNDDYVINVNLTPPGANNCVTVINGQNRNNCFLITATANSTMMLEDEGCRTFTLNWRGIKGGSDSTDSVNYDREFCWRDS